MTDILNFLTEISNAKLIIIGILFLVTIFLFRKEIAGKITTSNLKVEQEPIDWQMIWIIGGIFILLSLLIIIL
jgi:hypothetical protein